MRTFLNHIVPSLVFLAIIASGLVYLNCSSAPEQETISAQDLGKTGKLGLDELTPAEIKRLDMIINREASPCGNGYTLAQTILNPNLCPLAVYASDYIIGLLKQDYNAEEITNRYVERYADVEGLELPVEASPVKGAEKPLVTVVVFSSFRCPFCAKAALKLEHIVASWPEHVRLVFKHLPLAGEGSEAMLGARASFAAHRQDSFWEMHDTLYSVGRSDINPDKIRSMAVGLGLDVDEFEKDLASDAALAAIRADIHLAEKHDVDGTPTVFVNGRRLESGLEGLENRVKEELLRARF